MTSFDQGRLQQSSLALPLGDLESHAKTQKVGFDFMAPLADRMRPRSLAEYAGQQKVLGSGAALRRWIEFDRLPSLLLWGPPGCGKTTLAEIIAHSTQNRFLPLSAVHSGVKEIKESVEKARLTFSQQGRKTLLFVDEIHRFNKAQQDALLPHVETGTLTLIGATTENPSFELNAALLSRLRVIRLESLQTEDIVQVLRRALVDSERGLGGRLKLADEAIQWLAEISGGDARRALTSLESVSFSGSTATSSDQLNIDSGISAKDVILSQLQVAQILEAGGGRQPLSHDKKGEEHYNLLSAWIKSIRDGDPHAAVYYLARLLEAGEEPLLLARRLTVLASEDIGNADPRALQLAVATKDAVEFVGLPECRINLSQLAIYLAMAPKSNASIVAIDSALEEVRRTGTLPVPHHLRNAPTRLMKDFGYGAGYQYAHSFPGTAVKQTHLPQELIGRRFYHPTSSGLEKQIKDKLDATNPNFE